MAIVLISFIMFSWVQIDNTPKIKSIQLEDEVTIEDAIGDLDE